MNENNRNFILAIMLSIFIMMGWHYFYERPRIEAASTLEKKKPVAQLSIKQNTPQAVAPISREEAINHSKRVKIESKALSGSISLMGARIDDIRLNDYKETADKNSDSAVLLSPSGSGESYFAEVGWYSSFAGTTLPSADTIWKADKETLRPGEEVNLTWINEDYVKFVITISLDNDYMFTIKQSVFNNGSKAIAISPYGLINRNYSPREKAAQILHQGPIGSFGGTLQDVTFADVKEKKNVVMESPKTDWIGITDKYWLTAFIPQKNIGCKSEFSYANKGGIDKYQVDFIVMQEVVDAGSSYEVTNHLFAGAKKVNLLDRYESEYNIRLFDRAIDFGIFYIITKPLFSILNFFYRYCGNFGVSILIVTVLVKLAMFGMANKSYRSMKRMKALQPDVDRLKASYADDKVKFNQAVMELYKREKVNPVAGCLPLLVQIPVFFSLYKVLYVTIEMRHAPFFGWINDLSAPDPTSIFNLFGLLSVSPPAFLMIGVWPILMAITMYMQQSMSPPPADEVQAKVMKFMPLMFLFMFSNFPAGLLIYWTWNNILSIIQQYYINKQSGK
ncbi:MAG: membrane protein insertase YidC [Rickettsiaceae bacterium]|nr:membrane protein insertase YidC [Rickettsiaceae bacterium]